MLENLQKIFESEKETVEAEDEAETDGFAPNKEEFLNFSKEDWSSFINKNIKNFEGDKGKAGVLLYNLCDGMKEMGRRLEKGGVKVDIPRVAILTNEEKIFHEGGIGGKYQRIFYLKTDTSECVWVPKTILESDSRLKLDVVYQLSGGKKVNHIGTILDDYFLGGIEECHHAAYVQHGHQEKHGESFSLVEGESAKEHDALTIEYQALRWQVKIAKERKMPAETIRVLERKLIKAKKLREQT